MDYEIIIAFVVSYLLGAIPFSIGIGKVFYQTDVRKHGSGNAGATNTFRTLGTRAGIIVLFLDALKGAVAVSLAYYLGGIPFYTDNFLYYKLGLGITAVLGHIFSVYLRFKGGKGVATFLGAGLSIFPIPAMICIAAFLIVFFITRYVSLSSMMAAIIFPIVLFLYGRVHQWPILAFAIAVPLIITYTHRKNIRKLLNGTESKISFSNKN